MFCVLSLDGATSQSQLLHADTSLASLLFTDSSMDAFSLEQVVQQIDRNLTELSTSTEAGDSRGGARHSTPHQSHHSSERVGSTLREGGGYDDDGEGDLGECESGLELVGKGMKPQARNGGRVWSHRVPAAPTTTTAVKAKRRVRNYNNKDL